jgi:hypothetical protein
MTTDYPYTSDELAEGIGRALVHGDVDAAVHLLRLLQILDYSKASALRGVVQAAMELKAGEDD